MNFIRIKKSLRSGLIFDDLINGTIYIDVDDAPHSSNKYNLRPSQNLQG